MDTKVFCNQKDCLNRTRGSCTEKQINIALAEGVCKQYYSAEKAMRNYGIDENKCK